MPLWMWINVKNVWIVRWPSNFIYTFFLCISLCKHDSLTQFHILILLCVLWVKYSLCDTYSTINTNSTLGRVENIFFIICSIRAYIHRLYHGETNNNIYPNCKTLSFPFYALYSFNMNAFISLCGDRFYMCFVYVCCRYTTHEY